MNDRRSIQDIIPPARSKPIRTPSDASGEVVKPPAHKPETPPLPPRPQKPIANHTTTLIGIAFGVVVIIAGAFAIVSTLFHRADVTIVLNRYDVPVAETFLASPDGVLLSYSEKTVEDTATAVVPQSGSERVEERAEGTIIIYNAHSTGSQRLITNTRFETPEGLIYRIKNSVVIPGYKTVGGEKVPGELEVTVYADEPGEKYNIGVTDFTIPGLKGSPQFETMYARSKGPLQGGFVGERAKVDPAVRASAVADLKAMLEEKLKSSFRASLQNNELLLSEALAIEYVEQPDVAGENGATVRLRGIAKAPVFSEDKLASVIASEGGIRFEGTLALENENELSVLMEKPQSDGTISVTVSGTAKLVGVVDTERLVRDLAGKDQRNVGVVLSGYPGVADMKISVYPFWRAIIPEEISKINLIISPAVDSPQG